MKYRLSLLLMGITSMVCLSCGSGDVKPDTALNTGNAFIRASLDGNFDEAEKLLLRDTANIQMFNTYKRYYKDMDADKKLKYKQASYNINKFLNVNDSTGIINYSNSYMNEPMEIKLVKKGDYWKVDFKYTSSGNTQIQP